MGRRSAVIKDVTTGAVEGQGFRRFEVADLMAEAQKVVAAARAEAAGILDRARSQAEAIRQSAGEEGRRVGIQEGTRQGREAGRTEAFEAARREFAEQQKSLIESCQQTITDINANRAAWETSARQDLIDLAMAIARRVARCVGQRDREVVRANLEEAIQLAGARSDVTIMVSPADAEAARQFARSLVDMREQWGHIRVVEDPEVSPGGCRIQWGTGAVDARLETQLDRIETELAAAGPPGGDSDDRADGAGAVDS